MRRNPYDQEQDNTFHAITRQLRTPISPVPARHAGGRTMTRPDPPRTSRDQATLLLGCGGFVLMLSLAVAVIIIAWRW